MGQKLRHSFKSLSIIKISNKANFLRNLEGHKAKFLPFLAPQAKILRIMEGQKEKKPFFLQNPKNF